MGVPLANYEVIKHTAAIQIVNTFSAVERKVTNILLRNAYRKLNTSEWHSIKVSTLADAIGLNSNNLEEIKEAVRAVRRKEIEFNILGTDRKNDWRNSGLLSEVRIHDGVLYYSYPPTLREMLANPNIYTRLNLNIQRQFSGKYEVALWEFLCDVITHSKEDPAVSAWITLEEYRRLMGIENEEYLEFKRLNTRAIKDPLKTINRLSDVVAEVEYKKEGRNITALRFCVQKRSVVQLALALEGPELPDLETEQHLIEEEVGKHVYNRMVTDYGLTPGQARQFMEKYGYMHIQEMLGLVDREIARRKEAWNGEPIKNIAAYTVSVIRGDFAVKRD